MRAARGSTRRVEVRDIAREEQGELGDGRPSGTSEGFGADKFRLAEDEPVRDGRAVVVRG
jgi:hypothetical protein